MTQDHYAYNTAFLWVSITLLVASGCSGDTGEATAADYEPVRYSDKNGALDCQVTVWFADHTHRDATSPTVEVYWDGRKLFSGMLPNPRSDLTGLAYPLIRITTSRGTHVLEIRSEGSSQSQDVEFDEHGKGNYKIHVGGSKGLWFEDLGPDPLFM